MAHGSKKIVYAALGANAVIAVGKFIVGLATGSVAMLAEAAHSVADTINQGFLLVSINLSDNPADEEHPYGHGKERFFWAFLAAIFIFVAGALFSVYSGVQKVFGEHADHGSLWPAYLVLGLASILIGVVLIAVAIMLGLETRNLLLGAAAEPRHRQSIRAAISSFPEVRSIVAILTMQLGLNSILVTGEINLRDGLTTDEIEHLMERIDRSIREAVPAVKNIYLEPHCGRDGIATQVSSSSK